MEKELSPPWCEPRKTPLVPMGLVGMSEFHTGRAAARPACGLPMTVSGQSCLALDAPL